MLTVHRWLKTWESKVRLYIVFTDFYRKEFTKGGLPASKIVVKPHFVHPDPGPQQGNGAYALFIGRLAREKGVRTLLGAWKRLQAIPLKIRGEGPLTGEVQHAMRANNSCVTLLPRASAPQLSRMTKRARFLVWPSEGFYETFGLVAIESFACGVPVICSRLGAMEEIVADGRTGLHFTAGDAEDLAQKVEWAWTHPEEMAAMGRAARAEYEAKYTAERNYEMLMEIYGRVLGTRG
jgi:glycosyltransferase involved in cell wall biosynthesis